MVLNEQTLSSQAHPSVFIVPLNFSSISLAEKTKQCKRQVKREDGQFFWLKLFQVLTNGFIFGFKLEIF